MSSNAFSPCEYDLKIRRTVPYYDEMLSQITALLKAFNKDALRWLDIGCGTGTLEEAMLSDGTAEIERLVMCDISDGMLEVSRNRLSALGYNAELIKRSALELDYSGGFNAVTSVMVNHYFSRVERMSALKRCRNALDENGVFILFENIRPRTFANERLFLDMWRDFQLKKGKSPGEADKHIERFSTEYFPVTAAEHIALLDNCGFRKVETVWTSYMQAGFMGIK